MVTRAELENVLHAIGTQLLSYTGSDSAAREDKIDDLNARLAAGATTNGICSELNADRGFYKNTLGFDTDSHPEIFAPTPSKKKGILSTTVAVGAIGAVGYFAIKIVSAIYRAVGGFAGMGAALTATAAVGLTLWAGRKFPKTTGALLGLAGLTLVGDAIVNKGQIRHEAWESWKGNFKQQQSFDEATKEANKDKGKVKFKLPTPKEEEKVKFELPPKSGQIDTGLKHTETLAVNGSKIYRLEGSFANRLPANRTAETRVKSADISKELAETPYKA